MTPPLRYGVLADIHGNLPAFNAALAALDAYQPLAGLLVAGDILGGPSQNEILARLGELGAVMISGNWESMIRDLAEGRAEPFFYTARQFTAYRWAWQTLTPPLLAVIRGLPEQRVVHAGAAGTIRMAHGTPGNLRELLRPHKDPARLLQVVAEIGEDVLVTGHAHTSWAVWSGDKLGVNPGAVSFGEGAWSPGGFQAGIEGAQYAVLEWSGGRWSAALGTAPYDLAAIRRDFAASGFLDTGPLARAFLCDLVTRRNVSSEFFFFAMDLAQEAFHAGLGYIPDETWEQAGREFAWPDISDL